MGEDWPLDHAAIDDIIHGRIRLGAIAYLAAVESALFPELREKEGRDGGNLSTHLRKLEEAGYVSLEKSFVGRKPQTRIRLTAAGRRAWRAWLGQIEVLRKAAGA